MDAVADPAGLLRDFEARLCARRRGGYSGGKHSRLLRHAQAAGAGPPGWRVCSSLTSLVRAAAISAGLRVLPFFQQSLDALQPRGYFLELAVGFLLLLLHFLDIAADEKCRQIGGQH